jgi:hypothetical protein
MAITAHNTLRKVNEGVGLLALESQPVDPGP